MHVSWWILVPLSFVLADFPVSLGSVPAVLYSHKLCPGLLDYQSNYDESTTLPLSSFVEVAEKLISNRRSDAFVFVNIPGLTVTDFTIYRNILGSLEYYVSKSSTALRFERVEPSSQKNDLFDELIFHATEEWEIEDHIVVNGNHTETFERYIDWRPRTIRIDFDTVPLVNRREYFVYCDKIIKHVLGQLPSAEHTMILTSLSLPPTQVESEAGLGTLRIFPDVFEDPERSSDNEKNHQNVLNNLGFNEFRPKFSGIADEHLSVFDPEFLSRHYHILELVMVTTIGYIGLQLFLLLRARNTRTAKEKISAKKKQQ
ncbi:LANO_0H22936g1_1 [Lachancea nothofagi CBS 11611]|uniref:Protein BIG1 n=1 Tax=Lachancea nothofagi CBS 11611 TaxID=1266666 RepID=A0A1G4KNK3_9SACH|nr:LANO_0H22936g1_1 [Lachancea nothofagi CBS 11611]